MIFRNLPDAKWRDIGEITLPERPQTDELSLPFGAQKISNRHRCHHIPVMTDPVYSPRPVQLNSRLIGRMSGSWATHEANDR